MGEVSPRFSLQFPLFVSAIRRFGTRLLWGAKSSSGLQLKIPKSSRVSDGSLIAVKSQNPANRKDGQTCFASHLLALDEINLVTIWINLDSFSRLRLIKSFCRFLRLRLMKIAKLCNSRPKGGKRSRSVCPSAIKPFPLPRNVVH